MKIRHEYHSIIFGDITCYILWGNIVIETWRHICENTLYAKWFIMIIHFWKLSLFVLRHCGYQPHEDYGDLASYNGKGRP